MPMFAAGSLAACTLTMLCAGGPAPVTPESSLTLTLHTADGAARAVQLVCDPDSGTHPKARDACEALEGADGDFERLAPKNQPCPMIYAPLDARAHGHWRGERVDFRTEYSNSCVADAESAGVFAF
ncbi:serine protease [Prauserella sp. PE36]|uniref:Serine protease n=1 Tax=Prauserella endophytica TaxID=1592324 RepID=A0ABY2RYF7_9PSEU|nr:MULTISPECIES: SSI family serine proteinase inhibitor [Prauserella]PXY33629.1 serine protease [Prauserella coralliicola]RBM16031.1 serine protease [Prauserella sp. PE36]TKG65727.1 serine protease [Prauserella endophytica]